MRKPSISQTDVEQLRTKPLSLFRCGLSSARADARADDLTASIVTSVENMP